MTNDEIAALARKLDPASPPRRDGNDFLLGIHAALQQHGDKYPDRMVSVFHRNIVLGFVADAIRGLQAERRGHEPIRDAAPDMLAALEMSIPALEMAVEKAKAEWDEKHADCAYLPALLRPVEEARANLSAALTAIAATAVDRDHAVREAQDRLFDMLLGDDGQAWDEARKYLTRTRPDLIERINAA